MLEIIVGNIGSVYNGDIWSSAKDTYWEYVEQSKIHYGRAAGEDVTWFVDDEIYKEYHGDRELGSFTYAHLLEKLQRMYPEELQQTVTVFSSEVKEFYPVIQSDTTEEDDVLDAGHLYLIF